MDTSPPQSPPQQSTALANQAAKASWVCAVAIFILVTFGSRTAAQLIVERVALLLMAVGLLLGIIALFGIRKHGARGILVPALVGIATNGVLLFIFATNFFAARARARANMSAAAQFLPTVPASSHGNARGNYKSESLSFDYDGAYELKKNNETGQILLQNPDSSVVVSCLAEPVEMVATLKSQASAMQQALRDQSNTGFAQTDVESINGAIRSGSLMRIEYDKPALGRFHADVYILSARTNYISVVHIYPDKMKTNAGRLFATVLQSLKDGG
jgi:hypothetical protein